MKTSSIIIPEEVFDLAVESNKFFQEINGDSAEMHARDVLDARRPIKHGELLQRFAPLSGARVLEIGSGFGVNLIVWTKEFGADVYGLEPNAPEWGNSFKGSQILMEQNGLDPRRIIDGTGEQIPFDDETFDIVYSGNALEHVRDPERVLEESVRVLRAGGIAYFEVPNYLSYYESHYSLLMPPVANKTMLAWWVRLCGKDDAFAKSINTINPIWCRRAVRKLRRRYPISLITLGEDVFLGRLAKPWTFEMEQSHGNTARIVRAIQAVNLWNWIGRLIVAAQGFYPIFLTIRKENI